MRWRGRVRSRPGCGAAGLLSALLLAALLPASTSADAAREILVRLRAEGPHAVTDCAEARERRGQSLRGATRDGSDSLDRLHEALGVERVRAVFRRPDGRPFAAQRGALMDEMLGLRAERARASLPAPPDLSHVYRLRLAPGTDPAAAAARYREDPHVVWAQPNFPAALDLAADDPYLASSGSWGQSFADLFGIHRVEAPEAWDVAQGEGVVVAVVDTGLDPEHEDIADNVWVNPGEDLDGDGRIDEHERNGVDDDRNGFVDDFHGFDFANSIDADGDGDFDDEGDVSDADPFDDHGHGTHVSGTVAAVADNGVGVAGVAPRARIMAVKGFRATGSSPIALLVRGMVYAIENGADVINNSWSCGRRCPSNPIAEEAVALANALGVVVVTSAGNGGDEVNFYSPENRRGTIVAGASDPDDAPTFFTRRGLGLDVLAPGAGFQLGAPRVSQRGILSLLSSGAGDAATGLGAFVVGERYLRWSGTSMSSPHVAGIAALVLSHRPELTPEQVRGVIRGSARDLGAPGHDRETGAGLASALRALTREPPRAGGALESPAPASVLRPQDGPVEVRGRLFGEVADAALSFAIGWDRGAFEPVPLAVSPGPADGLLAVWDVEGLADGPYTLRLEVEARDGERVVEFLSVSLERNVPTPLSSGGPAARRPVVSGRTVVWQSARRAEGREEVDLDLFARDWITQEEWRVVGGTGDQHAPLLSGDRLAWKDDREDGHALASCRIQGSGGTCRDRVAVRSDDVFPSFDLSGRRLVWTERVQGLERLGACLWLGRFCHRLPVPPPVEGPTVRQSDALVTGARLYWNEWISFPPRRFTCDGFGGPTCRPTSVAIEGFTMPADAEGDLLAWNVGHVFACRVTRDGDCDETLLASGARIDLRSIVVSEHRIVWTGPGPGGDDDVHLCEYDRVTGACPVQRLNGSAANQRNADIDGNRVVWEDDGQGNPSVFGLELPSLRPVRDRTTRAGRTLRMHVRGRDPSGGAPALSAAFADGVPLAERGAHFQALPRGGGLLTWRPGDAEVGSHAVTFTGRAAGGLFARRSVRIQVLPRRDRPRHVRPWWWPWAQGSR